MGFGLSFGEIENLGILKRFQENLYALTGLAFDFVDIDANPSERLKAVSRFTSFCRLVYDSPEGFRACRECDIKALQKCSVERKPMVYKCHAGLTEIVVPLVIRERVTGFLTSGQFLTSAPGEEEFESLKTVLESYGLDSGKARKCCRQIPVVKKAKVKTIADLISIVGEYIIEAETRIMELQNHRERDGVHDAMEFARLHFREAISLKDAADAARLSPSRFAHIFRERTGTNFVSYVNELRIGRAKNLLSNTGLRVLEAAYQSGFRNLSHFNHVFRKKTGFSPTEYKKRQMGRGL